MLLKVSHVDVGRACGPCTAELRRYALPSDIPIKCSDRCTHLCAQAFDCCLVGAHVAENVEQYTGSCTDIPLSCLCYPCHYAGLIFEARVLCAHGAVVMQPKVDRLHLKAGLVRSLSSQDGYSRVRMIPG